MVQLPGVVLPQGLVFALFIIATVVLLPFIRLADRLRSDRSDGAGRDP